MADNWLAWREQHERLKHSATYCHRMRVFVKIHQILQLKCVHFILNTSDK